MVKYFEVGQIVNTFGIKGEVKVTPFTDDLNRFDDFTELYIEKKGELITFKIEYVKYHKNMVIIKFKGIDTMNDAEKYRNCYLKIDRKDAKKLPQNTYFIADLIGLPVYTDEGILLGNVDDIYNNGSSDIYVVKDANGKQVLLPSISDVLKQVDLENEKIIVHIIEGLI